MAETPYSSAKRGRLTFKGGEVATLSKSIDKKKKKKNKNKNKHYHETAPSAADEEEVFAPQAEEEEEDREGDPSGGGESNNIYTIDAAKKMNYQELFPVEAKKFKYHDPKAKETTFKSIEDALDDRVKKKADRYCK